ncbi:LysR family transcriptional regulator [Sporomusa acidovorans]|uniref:HTH-type transcriptional regulator GltC n=1 Tax=Sporomusa acidovorans (strain ATCC 49682 / DSM 3132 / Mol) TaxID=1123286 RepID=A0ABZ3J2B8_SPOA4|nr:LysR family transcriptional regulator [Sporomusa acidovorans]OZC13620.1 HTH-type transcriptional regulator GltC [Sporomusa acidovorans DSM 3132]SDE86636.1 DNA-binding transcriptional regulator, LysR family [Sporomusa acidovorans]
MEIRQLLIFVTAAQTLNFTKAAVQLGYTQANITNQIHQLEEELRVKLFERLGKGIRLTNAGRQFQNHAEAILEQCTRAKEELSPNIVKGVLKIGAAETLCVHRLPKILSEYRRRYPQVEIMVQTDSCAQLCYLLRDNCIDIGLALTNTIQQADMVVKTLYEESMAVVASPQHPLAKKQLVKPADLSGECFILTTEGCGYRPIVLAALAAHQVRPGSIMELSSVGAIKECTACGLGITILPEVAVHADLLQNKLTKISWQGTPSDVKTQLLFHKNKWLSPAIEAFLELCTLVDNH